MPETRLHESLGLLPMAAYACDPEGRIIACNERAVALWGGEPELGVTRYFGAVVISEDGREIEREETCMARALRSGKECIGCELVFHTREGRVVHTLASIKPFWGDDGKLAGAVGILADIRKQHQSRVELEKEIEACRKTELLIHEANDRHDHLLMHFLHEDIAQQLTGIALLGGILQKNLALEGHPLARKAAELSHLTSECMTTASSMAKGFYPLDIEVGGLVIALESLGKRTESHLKIACEVVHDDSFEFAERDAIHIYRIVEIAILRAVQNYGAQRVRVECRAEGGISSITVSHHPANTTEVPWAHAWVGINLLNSRARLIGATIHVQDATEGSAALVCRLRPLPNAGF